jgi:hypothetical protein
MPSFYNWVVDNGTTTIKSQEPLHPNVQFSAEILLNSLQVNEICPVCLLKTSKVHAVDIMSMTFTCLNTGTFGKFSFIKHHSLWNLGKSMMRPSWRKDWESLNIRIGDKDKETGLEICP